MKKIVLPFVFIALLATLISCATLLSESVYPVTITSDPSDAKITVTDSNKNIVFQGKTPAEVNLKAGNGFFKKPPTPSGSRKRLQGFRLHPYKHAGWMVFRQSVIRQHRHWNAHHRSYHRSDVAA